MFQKLYFVFCQKQHKTGEMNNSSGNGSDGNDPREINPNLEALDQFNFTRSSDILDIPLASLSAFLENEMYMNPREGVSETMHDLNENQNGLDDLEENHNGLQEESLSNLVVTTYSEAEALITSVLGEKAMCLICCENYKDGDLIVQLPCKHIFCKNCLFTWLKNNKTCPCCRDHVMPHLNK